MGALSHIGRRRRLINTFTVLIVLILIFVMKGRNESVNFETQNDEVKLTERVLSLQNHFLSQLNTKPATSVSPVQKLLSYGKAKKSNYTATIVIGRLNDEPDSVQWVYDNLVDIDDPQIYIVDNPDSTLPHLEQNHGREAAVYLSYIVDNYNQLPDVTFFWHSSEIAWHNNLFLDFNSSITINSMDRDYIVQQGYVPSRCDQWPGCPNWIRFNPSRAEHRLDPHRLEEMFNADVFSTLFPQETEYPPFFAGTCCSQFAVSRDIIQGHTISFYENLLNWVQDLSNDDLKSGRLFEFIWPYIFLGKGTHCPTMQDCYCRTYNFCMDDVAQLEKWNALRTRREEVQWQLLFMENALAVKYNTSRDIGASQYELREIQKAFLPEISRLTSDLEYLANSTWEAREVIIHEWDLGVPPIGW